MIESMAHRRENERQEEAKENESDPQELSRRRASLIAEFQGYIHVTFHELHLASQAETEALRSPLLSMQCTEEDIRAWEQFQSVIPKLLHSARTLHTQIHTILHHATLHHLLPPEEIAHWKTFFQGADAGFQEKEYHIKKLVAELTSWTPENDEQSLRPHEDQKERREKREEKETSPRTLVQKRSKVSPSSAPPKEPLPSATTPIEPPDLKHLTTTQQHARWLLTLLPSSIAPLYIAAAKRGSTALHAVQKTLERSLVRQNFGLQHQGEMVILSREELQNTEGSLATCETSATQGEEAKTVILEPISLASQSAIVHGIHQTLLQNLRTLERHGMHV